MLNIYHAQFKAQTPEYAYNHNFCSLLRKLSGCLYYLHNNGNPDWQEIGISSDAYLIPVIPGQPPIPRLKSIEHCPVCCASFRPECIWQGAMLL